MPIPLKTPLKMKKLSLVNHVIMGVLVIIFLTYNNNLMANEEKSEGLSCAFAGKHLCIGGLSLNFISGDKKEASIAVDLLIRKIAEDIGLQGTIVATIEETSTMLDELKNKRIDTVITDPIGFFELQPYLRNEYLYSTTHINSNLIKYKLVTLKSQGITHINQLRGKRLAMAKNNLVGKMFLEMALAKAGFYGLDAFFSQIYETEHGTAAINSLIFDQADVSVSTNLEFNSAINLNHQINQQVVTLTESDDEYPLHIIAIHKDAPDRYVKRVDGGINKLMSDKRNTKLFSLIGVTSVIKLTEQQLQNLRQFKQDYQHCVVERSAECVVSSKQ